MLGNKRMTNKDGVYAAMSLVLLGSLVAAMLMPDEKQPANAHTVYAESPLVTVTPHQTTTDETSAWESTNDLAQVREDAAEVMLRLQKMSESKSSQSKSGELREPDDLAQYRAIEVIATGYTAGYESTGKNPGHPQYGITYSGVKVRRDHVSTIAADLSVFPLGTLLWIPDYGYGIVADIGGAIKGNKIDLYFENTEDVYAQWGKKTLDVYIIEPGEGQMNEQILAMKLAGMVE